MNIKIQNGFHYFNLPGIVLHEIAHALIILLLPNVWIKELNLTSHVEYEGYYNTATRTFIIAYAPLFINTVVSVLCVYKLAQLDNFATIKLFLYSILLIYISLTTAFASLPSKTDAVAPLKILRNQIFTRRFPVIILFGPIFIIASLPGLIISYISSKSIYIQIILCLIYATLVFLIGFEIITLTDMENFALYLKSNIKLYLRA